MFSRGGGGGGGGKKGLCFKKGGFCNIFLTLGGGPQKRGGGYLFPKREIKAGPTKRGLPGSFLFIDLPFSWWVQKKNKFFLKRYIYIF